MKLMIRLAFLSLLLAALPVLAQPMHWNMAGSSGVVDEANAVAANYAFTGLNVHHAGPNLGNIVLRYPVTNVFGSGLATAPPWATLEIAHTDNGGGAGGFVQVRLMQINRCSNVEAPLFTWTSIDGPPNTVCAIVPTPALNFGTNIY